MLINKEICEQILTIAPHYIPPKGGVMQVIYNYDKCVFEKFQFLPLMKGNSIITRRFSILISLIKLFFKLLFNRNIKIVHIHSASYRSFLHSVLFMKIAKMYNRKVVMHIHGGGFAKYYETNPKWIKLMLDRCDIIVALTQYWENFFKEKVGCRNVVQINNIIEAPQYIETTKNNNCKHILFLGQVCKNKGIYDLVDVIKEHKSEFNGKMVLHIGGGGETEKLNAIIEKNSLQDIIIYEGWVGGNKKISLFNDCDIYILPSYIEGLPISILEALSYGHYIISTTVGGIPEIITNEEAGVLINPGNKEELYEVLRKTIDNKSLGETREKRITISKKHQPLEVAKELLKTYKKLL